MLDTRRLIEYSKSYGIHLPLEQLKSLRKNNRSLQLHPENLKTKSIFIHIPKTAGFAVAQTLYGRDPWHFSFDQYAELVAAQQMSLDEFYVFTVVRHPVDRLNSMYQYLRRRPRVHRAMVPLKLARDIVEFAEMFQAISSKPRAARPHPFYTSQMEFCGGDTGLAQMNFVGRTESLNQEFPQVSQSILGEETPLLRMNETKNKVALTPAERDKLSQIMREEIEFLQY